MNLDQQNQLESYLSGHMPPDEMKTFEASLGSNPELQQEVHFQSDIIKGIGEYRKSQLKARLDAIQVTPGYWFGLQGATIAQLTTGVATVLLIGAGSYWYFGTFETEEVVQNTEVVEEEVITPTVNDTPVSEEIEADQTSEKINESKQENKAVQSGDANTSAKTFEPRVAVPKSGDVEDEKEFTPDNLPTPEEGEAVKQENTPIEVEVIDGRNAKIKYRYYAGKLYLYGDFTAEPYEILEINASSGRRIYLYHLNEYYEITPTDKPANVVAVTDTKLIQELTILRKEK